MTKIEYKALKGKIIAKILGEDRDRTFKKKVTRDDGSIVFLHTTTTLRLENIQVAGDTHMEVNHNLVEMDDAEDGRSKVFVRTAVVVSVGEGVSEFKKGDVILLDFKVDNMAEVVVAQEGEDKVISLNADTKYFKEDIVIHASQKQPRDMNLCFKGEVQDVSPIIAIVRGDKIIANHPYVILKHVEIPFLQVNKNGVLGFHSEELITREVIGVSNHSTQEFGIENGMKVMVKESDTFNIVWDGQTITAINDADVMTAVN